jgi:hypothetical protein
VPPLDRGALHQRALLDKLADAVVWHGAEDLDAMLATFKEAIET